MTAQRFVIAFIFVTAGVLCGAGAHSGSPNQVKRSKSDADINAIGRRNLGEGLDFYSLEHEAQLGKQLAKQVDRSAKLVDDPEITQYVDRIGQRLARNTDVRMPVTFRVIDSDKISAFTLPGGYQYVNRGLLEQLNGEAELAGAGAWDCTDRPAFRYKRGPRGDIAQMAAISAMISVLDEYPMSRAVASAQEPKLMFPLTAIKQEREDESAADYFGLQYVYVSGYDPECYVNLIERIWPQAASSIAPALSTSPPLQERLAAMRKEIASILPKRSSAVVSTPAFAHFQEQVRTWKRPSAGEPR